ncbi:MAG TPA: hypothetical protein VN107_02290 [Microbacterium sp.]|nr:hypothetical protein [Microbacterium sp.]
MSTAADEQVRAMRSMLVAHAQHDVDAAPSRRLRRGIIAGALVIGGAAGGFGVAVVANGSVVPFGAPVQPRLVTPVSYFVNQIPEFKRAQQPTDQLPAGTGIDTARLVPGSVRYAGEYKGVRYYLAQSGTAQKITSIDLIVFPASDPSNFVIGGASGLPFTVQNHSYGPATVPGNGHRPPAGSVQISQSVYLGQPVN